MNKEYNEGKYSIAIYKGGGTIRNRLNDEILATFTDWWTEDGSIHEETQNELDIIKEKLGIIIKIRQQQNEKLIRYNRTKLKSRTTSCS